MSLIKAKRLVDICIRKKVNIGLAESCTGGLLASKIVSVPDASRCFKLGLVTYSNNSKIKLLNICPKIIAKYGAVSMQTASSMVKGLTKLNSTGLLIAITGIAGPKGGTKDKPVGLVFFGFSCCSPEKKKKKKIFKGERDQIRKKAATYALSKSIKILES